LFQLMTTPRNVFNGFPDASKVSEHSVILTVDLYDESGNRLDIKDTREPIEIVLGRPGSVQPRAEYQYAVMSSQDDRVDLFYYQVNVTNNDSSLHIEISQLNDNVQLLVLARFREFPQLNSSDQETRGWDFMQLLPISMAKVGQSPARFHLLCRR